MTENPTQDGPTRNGGGPPTPEPVDVPPEAPVDPAERPGATENSFEHDDELADEWGRESFPSSDPPAHY